MNTKHLHVLQKQLLLFLFLILVATACRDDKDKGEEPMKSETYYDGEVRIAHTGQQTVPGLYDCYFTNREDNSELVVAAIVYSKEGDIVFIPKTSIRTGEYYFNRAVTIETDKPEDKELIGEDVPLGLKISFTSTDCVLGDEKADPVIGCYGTGTKEDPYRITSYLHLQKLMKAVNSTEQNNKKYGDKYYIQTADLSLARACANLNVGWNSIGNHISRPFFGHYDGQGKVISDMTVRREQGSVAQPAGLFGIVINATIGNVKLEECEIESDFAVAGMLAGSVISTGSRMLTTAITNCSVDKSCKMKASYLVGGLVGGVNQYARLIMTNCSNEMPISTKMPGAGGLIGASLLTSTVTLDNCSNTADISSEKGIVGGLIGSTDTLLINNCWNNGAISGGSNSIGTGGLIGGGTNVVASFCENQGRVTGDKEVGGILGSASRSKTEKAYGDARIYASSNAGYITGTSEVGGLVGSAQILISGSYNFNTVTATGKNAGGLAGLGPIAVIIASSNDGDVKCNGSDDDSFVGGILGSAQDYTLTACNNFGNVTTGGKATVGGILGGCDLLGIVSYCGNFGDVTAANGSVGGIIGRAGKPKNMSDKMIADMVLGTALSIASVGMSGGSADLGPGKMNMAKMMKIDAQLDIAGTVLGSFTLVNDFAWTVANNVMEGSTLTPDALKHLEVKTSEKLQAEHAKKISTMYWSNGTLTLTQAVKEQQTLQDAFIKRLQATGSPYQDNIDTWRNKTEGKMHAAEKSRDIASHAGEAISFAGDILGYCPVPNPVSIVVTVVVAFYNLVMNLTDYSYNRVGIFQSFNYGTVTASSGSYFGGGIAGELHDYARLYNSANFGRIAGTKIGMLIGKGGHLPELTHSVNFCQQLYNGNGQSEYHPTNLTPYQGTYYSCPFFEEIRNNVNAGPQDVFAQKSYTDQGFDFNKSWSWWKTQNIPLVYQSEFE